MPNVPLYGGGVCLRLKYNRVNYFYFVLVIYCFVCALCLRGKRADEALEGYLGPYARSCMGFIVPYVTLWLHLYASRRRMF